MKEYINKIVDAAKEVNIDVYIVGGYIRDKLIDVKNNPKALDIVYKGEEKAFINALVEKGLVLAPYGTENFISSTDEGGDIYISRLKQENIEEFLAEADFTLNALAIKLADNKVIDPFGGRAHIKSRIIQEVNEKSIKDDRTRILKAFCLSLKYGMHLSSFTEQHIVDEAPNIKKADKEKLFEAFMSLIEEDSRGMIFQTLDSYGILKYFMPYNEEIKTVGKCKYHTVDVFTHSNKVYEVYKELINSEYILKGLDLKSLDGKIAGYSRADYLALAAYTHDIGKYKCYKKEGEKITFYGHDHVGAKIVDNFCKDFGFPEEAAELITKVVEGHMYPLSLYKNKGKEAKKSFEKFFSKYGKFVPCILTVSFCDVYATRLFLDPDNEKEKYKEFIEQLFYEYNVYIHDKE